MAPFARYRRKRLLREHLLFIGKNLIRMILLLIAVSIAAFVLVSVSPIDPLQANVGQVALGSMSAEQIANAGVPIELYIDYGYHDWTFWRHSANEFLRKLFV